MYSLSLRVIILDMRLPTNIYVTKDWQHSPGKRSSNIFVALARLISGLMEVLGLGMGFLILDSYSVHGTVIYVPGPTIG